MTINVMIYDNDHNITYEKEQAKATKFEQSFKTDLIKNK